MKRLREILGVNQKVGLKAGDEVFHPIYGFLKEPDLIVEDIKEEAYIYAKKYGKYFLGVVISKENPHYIYTVQPMTDNAIKLSGRYIKLYERKT